MVTPESIQASITAGIDCQHCQVAGDGQHFEGLRSVRRHQLVYAALGDRMREEIHALSMKTLTPDEWKA